MLRFLTAEDLGHYPRLRETCQTDVDGTSIDMLEALAIRFGLVAEQIMLPTDCLFLKALPGQGIDIHLPVSRSGGRKCLACHRILFDKCLADLVTYLISLGSDCRPQPGEQAMGRCLETGQGGVDNACLQSAPTGMHRGHLLACVVADQDR